MTFFDSSSDVTTRPKNKDGTVYYCFPRTTTRLLILTTFDGLAQLQF